MSDSVQGLQADFEVIKTRFAKLQAALQSSTAEGTSRVSRSLRSALRKLDQLAFHHDQSRFNEVNLAFAKAREAAETTLNEFTALGAPVRLQL